MTFENINLDIDNPWLISDTHFCHTNIIKYCNRPFKDVNEMNETIISNWNSVVKSDDWIVHLGDVSFGRIEASLELLKRLNGNKILISGNHDFRKHIISYTEQGIFQQTYKGEGFEFQNIILSHKPIVPEHLDDRTNYHGHLHNTVLGTTSDTEKYNIKYNLNQYRNISIENYKYFPVQFKDIK